MPKWSWKGLPALNQKAAYERDAWLLVRVEVDGLSTEQAAAEFGLTVGTVRSRLRRARDRGVAAKFGRRTGLPRKYWRGCSLCGREVGHVRFDFAPRKQVDPNDLGRNQFLRPDEGRVETPEM